MKKRHIAIIQSHSSENESLYQASLLNHAQYAAKHNYDMIQWNMPYKEAVWDGILFVIETLKQYDHLFAIGSDVVFTNMDIPLSNFIDTNYGLILSEEKIGGSNINNDTSIYNNNEKGFWVLEKLYSLRDKFSKWPFAQGATIEILKTPEGKNNIKCLPVRQLQSTPYSSSPSAWKELDFSLHFLGMTNEQKENGVSHFLKTREVIWVNFVNGKNQMVQLAQTAYSSNSAIGLPKKECWETCNKGN